MKVGNKEPTFYLTPLPTDSMMLLRPSPDLRINRTYYTCLGVVVKRTMTFAILHTFSVKED